ncbi:MAG: hypothetical protein K6G19_06115 [Lachnospiraceae bacterium]|nr:hypothetical protein [Lachnospiraceae bacterium]
MAQRPVFVAEDRAPFFRREYTEFVFYSGFSVMQKQRSIRSLHDSYSSKHSEDRILEISSKSEVTLGNLLSAFNLSITTKNGLHMTVETAFQGSKVFENGGPYTDLYGGTSIAAKKDVRLRESGRVIGFSIFGNDFPTTPETFFYDWLYVNALNLHQEYHEEIMRYSAFTDIEFNPQRSINCQAEAAALFVGLKRSGQLQEALESKESFENIVFR